MSKIDSFFRVRSFFIFPSSDENLKVKQTENDTRNVAVSKNRAQPCSSAHAVISSLPCFLSMFPNRLITCGLSDSPRTAFSRNTPRHISRRFSQNELHVHHLVVFGIFLRASCSVFWILFWVPSQIFRVASTANGAVFLSRCPHGINTKNA